MGFSSRDTCISRLGHYDVTLWWRDLSKWDRYVIYKYRCSAS